jgi:hypothetical protein
VIRETKTEGPIRQLRVGIAIFLGAVGASVAVLIILAYAAANAPVATALFVVALLALGVAFIIWYRRDMKQMQMHFMTELRTISQAGQMITGTARVIAAQPEPAPAVPQLPAPGQIDITRLTTWIPTKRGGFEIELSQLDSLIRVHPFTARSALTERGVVSGGDDHHQLILAGEHLGWLSPKARDGEGEGQGVRSEWLVSPAQAREHLKQIKLQEYVAALERAQIGKGQQTQGDESRWEE